MSAETICKCCECKYCDVLEDNHHRLHRICVCAESENFLKRVSILWDECNDGKKESEEEDEE